MLGLNNLSLASSALDDLTIGPSVMQAQRLPYTCSLICDLISREIGAEVSTEMDTV